MENLKKWFNFGDTLDGKNFLIRWVIASIIQFPGGYLTGLGLASGNNGYLVLGLIIATIGIVLQFSTLIKRSKALFSTATKAYVFYTSYLFVSIFQGFAQNMGQDVLVATNLVMILMFGYAIFKNSGIAEHEG